MRMKDSDNRLIVDRKLITTEINHMIEVKEVDEIDDDIDDDLQ